MNWKAGEKVDIVAYYNNADEVELFLNGRSQGTKRKQGDEMRVFWRLAFEPGLLKAVSRKNGQVVLSREVRTAGMALAIVQTKYNRPGRIVLKASSYGLEPASVVINVR